MPKSHDRPHREAKKPKADKKKAPAAPATFLKPQPSPAAPAKPKDDSK